MSHVFLSYKREDEARVAILFEALEGAGLVVWWDRKIPAGDNWRQRILAQLESAQCVIVVWTEASTGPNADFVIEEATRAKRLGTLLPVRLDEVDPPFGFGEQQALDLIGWKGDSRDPRFRDLLAAAKARIEGRPVPPPQARRRRAAAWLKRAAIIAAVVGFVADFATGLRIVCKVPGVAFACGEWGLGGVPSRAEREVWSQRRAGDCDALRSYLSLYPKGAYTAESQARLAAAKSETREVWLPEVRRLPLAVRSSLQSFPSEQAARADAVSRAGPEAQRICAGFDQAEFRLVSAEAEPIDWRCSQRSGGHACAFDGEAVCKVEARRLDRIESCP